MFSRKDYVTYFDQLYQIELGMEKEGRDLLKLVKHPEAQKLIKALIRDEVRHKRIVKSLMKLID